MKIAVLGASGKTGTVFVKAALEAGHDVRAGYYGTKLKMRNSRLEKMSCNALDAREVKELVEDCDAVVSLIGHAKGTPDRLQSDVMRLLSTVLRDTGVKRLVSLTGTGARVDGDTPSLIDRLATIAISTIDPERVKDGKEHVEVLAASELDWTIVRVLKLTNGPAKPFSFDLHGNAMLLVPRETVALAILEVLDAHSHIRECPIIIDEK